MLRLDARSIGDCLARSSSGGYVHSIFPHSANLAVPADRGPEILATLVMPHAGHLPGSVTVDWPGNKVPQGLAVGDPVALRGGILRLGTVAAVDLRRAPIWSSRVDGLTVDLNRLPVRRAWNRAWLALQRSRPTPWVGCPESLSTRLRMHPESAGDLLDALLAELIGRGPGLTPAGDDWLVGFLVGLWSSLGCDPQRQGQLRSWADRQLERALPTTDISRHFLRCAGRGHAAQRLLDLARGIGAGSPPPAVDRYTRLALTVGASSGPAGVCGLLWGMAAPWPLP